MINAINTQAAANGRAGSVHRAGFGAGCHGARPYGKTKCRRYHPSAMIVRTMPDPSSVSDPPASTPRDMLTFSNAKPTVTAVASAQMTHARNGGRRPRTSTGTASSTGRATRTLHIIARAANSTHRRAAGHRFVWAREARVFETIPPEKAGLAYMLREEFRRGSATVCVDRLIREKAAGGGD